MKTNQENQERARFTARIEFLEEPQVAEQLERMAYRNGGSVAAEIRRAVRRQLQDKEA